ncbi:MAG: hypothetical protein PHP98_10880, partial [Kiritimatiellae bacterium]|nr:hypothetical protein [Kiritimatiellia bacterium]
MYPARKHAKRIPSGILLVLITAFLAAAGCSCRMDYPTKQNIPECEAIHPKPAETPEFTAGGMKSYKLSAMKNIKFDVWHQSKKDYTINHNGFVEDAERPGEKIYKLDVTLETGASIYLGIPYDIPLENPVTLKWIYRIGEESSMSGTYNFGGEMYFRPAFGGYVYKGFSDFPVAAGGWKTVETDDVFQHARTAAHLVARKYFTAVEPENLSPRLNRFAVYMSGGRGAGGARIALYIRDIVLSGAASSDEDMQKIISARWEPVRERYREKAAAWKLDLEQVRGEMAQEAESALPQVRKIQQELMANLNALARRVESVEKNGSARRDVEEAMRAEIKGLKRAGGNLKLMERFLQNGNAYLPFVVAPISDLPILPDESINLCAVGEISTEIKITAAPGEFQPASFVVCALSDIAGLKPIASKLENAGKIIPSENIDVKLVKCWYQAGTAGKNTSQQSDKRVLVPELLLNDDSLVKVDREQEKNFLKLSFPGREKYVWISNPDEKESGEIEGDYELGHYKLLLPENFPVRDSPRLLPVDAAKNSNRQFWVTIKTPEDAAPGTYTGKIDLVSSAGNIGSFSLELKVLPFKLSPPYYVSSVYYRAQLSQKYPRGTVSSEYKSGAQLAAELKNMAEHGVLNPTCYQPFSDKALLEQHLAARKKAGMDSDVLYWCYALDITSDGSPEGILKLKERVADALKALKGYGLNDVYFYGKDEAQGEALAAQRRDWQAIHEAGGKVFVAGYLRENFEKMGDIQDLLICAGQPSADEAAKWRSAGHKIWCYANPQAGVENPAVYRRNYGILLWQNDYDGAATFAYHTSYGNIWNDFDGHYRNENFTYPTVDGVIDTLAWEGYREGVDDVRYLTTLLNEIKIAKNKPGRSGAAAA